MAVGQKFVPDETVTEAPSVDECRAQLGRILVASDFEATDRAHRILQYVVGEALAGHGEQIKAYNIALDVLGRDATFDAKFDPIVRIEAGHLRRALERYYFMAGRDDPVVITIPKGAYVPVFSRRLTSHIPLSLAGRSASIETMASGTGLFFIKHWRILGLTLLPLLSIAVVWGPASYSPTRLAAAPDIPRIVVEPFEDLSQGGGSDLLAKGLTQEIITNISRFKDVSVVEPIPGNNLVPPAQEFRFALVGSVKVAGDKIQVLARVSDRINGTIVWADSYDGNLKVDDLLQIERDIASQVATALAQTYGVIFQVNSARTIENPPDDWNAYACTLSYYVYRTDFDVTAHPTVRRCLETSVARFPNYATAWALLSQTYVDEVRFHYAADPASTKTSIDLALSAARRAMEVDPQNVRSLQAQMLALFFNGDFVAAMKVGAKALELNPNDTELMGEYGYRLALWGDWDHGCPLVAEARERNPGPLAYYEAALSLCAYFQGNYPEAAMWIRKTTAPDNANYHIIAAAVFAEEGSAVDATREVEWLMTHVPGLVATLPNDLKGRLLRPEDRERMFNSLRKAGLPITD